MPYLVTYCNTVCCTLLLCRRITFSCGMEFQSFNIFLYIIVLFVAFVFMFSGCWEDDSFVDNNQLQEYPFCGKMNYPEITKGTNGRSVNTKNDDENYLVGGYKCKEK